MCYLANTINAYQDQEEAGTNVYFVSFGWHVEQGSK